MNSAWVYTIFNHLVTILKGFGMSSKNILKFALRLLFSLLCMISLSVPVSAAVVINEFSVNGSEWVELMNTDTAVSVDLTGWHLRQSPGLDQSLSGTLPAGGLLTFTQSGSQLTDDSGEITLFSNTDAAVYSVNYSVETIDPPGPNESARQVPDARADLDGSWVTDDSISKGWFNATGGAGQPPSTSTIANLITAQGIATNFADLSDHSRATGLWFEKSGKGKIAFSAEMNMTDQTVVAWLQQLGSKLDMSTTAQIGLDADVVRSLLNTQATLTMFGLSLSNPEITIDGQVDSQGQVTGLSYDQATGTLTFGVPHFTTYRARERQNSNSQSGGGSVSTATATPTSCGDMPPSNVPQLFQINSTRGEALLYFTPVNDRLTAYTVAYGLSPVAEQFGARFDYGLQSGVVSLPIRALNPGSTYYFRVRGENGCTAGPWSNTLAIKVAKTGTITSYLFTGK